MNSKSQYLGNEMFSWVKDLFPICRSITGAGVRESLSYLQKLLPDLIIQSVPSGTKAFDWTVPDEWNIRDAYIADEDGNRVVDFKKHNLHVVGYSEPVDIWLTREELDVFLYSLPDQPDAIPYITTYYKRCWGFCLTHKQRLALPEGRYRAVIDSDLEPGVLNYGELILPGCEKSEVLLSTYVCHPSMANNELSGPVVTTALARWLNKLDNRRFTYRIVFLPETIGSIVYLSRHLDQMRQFIIAGFVITCVGDDRGYSYLPSRNGRTLSDRITEHVLKNYVANYMSFSFLERGSDERQYCSPGIELPVCSVSRTKYAEYPEYHTSLDDLSLVTATGLQGGFEVLQKCIQLIEANRFYRITTLCEPQLGKRGLYPLLSTKETKKIMKNMMNILAYADGSLDLIELAEKIDCDALRCAEILAELEVAKLVVKLK